MPVRYSSKAPIDVPTTQFGSIPVFVQRLVDAALIGA
jgi:hypothetical protein